METADWISKQIGEVRPVIGLICGLAFNGIVEIMEETIRLAIESCSNKTYLRTRF